MISLRLHKEESGPYTLRVGVRYPDAGFMITDNIDGAEIESFSLKADAAYLFGRDLWRGVLDAMPASPRKDGLHCELCGRRCQDGEYFEWKIPAGPNAVIHHTCIVEMVELKRREREAGSAPAEGSNPLEVK